MDPTRGPGRPRIDERRRPDDEERRPSARPVEQPLRDDAPNEGARGRRGFVVVLGVFLVTLLGGALDSFIGNGLGTVTLVALVASTAIATLMVRRRDMVTVMISPPLVFVAVAGLNIALAPSLTPSLYTVATLLVRGFPTMAVATAGAILLVLIRLITRR